MSGFLRNTQEFNDYIIDLVYHGERFKRAKRSFLKDYNFVKERKEAIISIMISQWMKREVKEYLLRDENLVYLSKVYRLDANATSWQKQVFATGEAFYDFDPNLTYPDFYDEITKIRDYLYVISETYLDAALANKELIINILKKEPKYSTFEKALSLANAWHHEVFYQSAENIKSIPVDLGGTKDVITFKSGFKFVLLETPEALDAESEMMGHSAGDGAYDAAVVNGSIQIYSLRDENGMARVSMEVRNKKIFQCKGPADKPPAKIYIQYIQAFVNHAKLVPQYDIRNMGLVKGVDNQYYNLYDLPQNFSCEMLDLRGLDLSNFKTPIGLQSNLVNITGAYNLPKKIDFSRCKKLVFVKNDFSDVEEFIFPMNEAFVMKKGRGAPQIADFSMSGDVSFVDCSFKGCRKIKFPRGRKTNLNECSFLPTILDFSMCGNLDLNWNNFAGVKQIHFAPDVKLNMTKAKNLPETLDFFNCGDIDLSYSDFNGVTSILLPQNQRVVMQKVKNLPTRLDFSKTSGVDLSDSDFKGVAEIKFPARQRVVLSEAKHLPKTLDFSKSSSLDLSSTDFYGVKEIIFPYAEFADLSGAKNLPKILNLTQLSGVDFSNTDFSGVKQILIPSDNHGFEIKGVAKFNAKNVKKLSVVDGQNYNKGFWSKLFG